MGILTKTYFCQTNFWAMTQNIPTDFQEIIPALSL
jgi:ABC-type anion transport system duplicated permease subunit